MLTKLLKSLSIFHFKRDILKQLHQGKQLKVRQYILPFAHLQWFEMVVQLCLANFDAGRLKFQFAPHFRCFKALYSSAE